MKQLIAVFILLAVGSVSAQACCGARSHKFVDMEPVENYEWNLSTDFRQDKYKNTGQVKEFHTKRGVGQCRWSTCGSSGARFHVRATRIVRGGGGSGSSTGGGGSRIIKKAQ